jgi:hypothetical protein
MSLGVVACYIGHPYVKVFGLCETDKKYLAWYYMLLVFMSIPKSAFFSHFIGLFAGLLIKFCGLYVLLPR